MRLTPIKVSVFLTEVMGTLQKLQTQIMALQAQVSLSRAPVQELKILLLAQFDSDCGKLCNFLNQCCLLFM